LPSFSRLGAEARASARAAHLRAGRDRKDQ
jgi:hypothetical protein